SGLFWLMRWGLAATVIFVGLLFTQRHFEGKTLRTLLQTAERYEKEGDLQNAVSYLSRYFAASPDDAEVASRLANLYARGSQSTGGLLRSVQLYRHALTLDPERVELGITAAQIATNIREFELAL